ncbi:prenyltransferase [Alteromonas gilva]|uniref:Prenyltransferase n=1 Tax=Alteromonas gilva TaxID=2987522 RepID=A0ABT5L3L8_9ALTE|nr:prenyltransferase [Alteromonas gilva]MDC8831024.1 prenyltransferase [Alteromonas gilva]
MTVLSTIVSTMRPPFLLLVVSCLSLGIGFACYVGIQLSADVLSWIVVCGVSAHIAVNMLNEYVDCVSKLDFATRKTPFSGGSGALVQQPGSAKLVKYTGLLFVGITIGSGLLVIQYSPAAWLTLAVMGVVGIVIVVSYTPVLNRMPWLCLIAPGLGFGVLMTYGGFVAISGQHHTVMFTLALVPAMLTNNLLLINQFPDATADAQHGRKHVVTQYGYVFCAHIYLIQWLLTLALITGSVMLHALPLITLLGLLPLVFGWRIYHQALNFKGADSSFQTAMGQNVLMTLASPFILGVTLCVGA